MISHKHRSVFVHIPKCAGQSIETAFLDDLGLNWESRGALLLRPNDCPSIGPPRLAHLIARDYVRCHHLSKNLFDDYCVFTVVRNPWARTVSLYRYLDNNESFSDFVLKRLTKSLATGETDEDFWFFRPQTDYTTDTHGKTIVDRIIKFEELENEFSNLAKEINLIAPLKHVNRSNPGIVRKEKPISNTGYNKPKFATIRRRCSAVRRQIGLFDRRTTAKDWQNFYDEKTQSHIAELYASDIETFGYSFKHQTEASVIQSDRQ